MGFASSFAKTRLLMAFGQNCHLRKLNCLTKNSWLVSGFTTAKKMMAKKEFEGFDSTIQDELRLLQLEK